MRLLCCLSTFLIFYTSCVNKSDPEISLNSVLTPNEDKGIKDILSGFGGYCAYGFGSTVSSEKNAINYFWLELSKCKMFDTYNPHAKDSGMFLSQMAYLFYNNLNAEKNKYSEIHSTIIYNDGTRISACYKMSELEIVKSKQQIVLNVVDLLKRRKYDSLRSILSNDSSVFKVDKEQLINNLRKYDSTFGKIKGYRQEGYYFQKFKNGKTTLHISGMLLRDKTNNNFSIDLDSASVSDEILYLNYQF